MSFRGSPTATSSCPSANLDGVIVHVEHLERGTNENRHAVEAYRIPYLHTIAKVRINVGEEAPCSVLRGKAGL